MLQNWDKKEQEKTFWKATYHKFHLLSLTRLGTDFAGNYKDSEGKKKKKKTNTTV